MTTTAAAALPVVSFDALCHIGTAAPDGLGLPVIRPLTTRPAATATTWRFARHGNLFLDHEALSTEQRTDITAWGIAHGYVAPIAAYRIDYLDTCTGFAHQFMLTDLSGAIDVDLVGLPSTVTEIAALAATGAFPDPTVPAGTINPLNRLALAWSAAECPALDGVWWNIDRPHGIIHRDRLSAWIQTVAHAAQESR